MMNLSLNLLIPVTVALSCVIFVIANFLVTLRKLFAITVNCWFCNTNSRVPYEQRNAFSCPSCSQYNGFSENGNYNREMPEQHYSKLNASKSGFCQRTEIRLPHVNGLCEPCNRNQEMKVIQLANFKPRVEAKYDEEIEDYRQKLEDSYQLCQKCQHHLLKTLNRVKTKFIGSRLTQLMNKGVPIVAAVKAVKKNRQLLGKLTMATIFVLSVANLIKDLNISIRSITSDSMQNVYFHIVALYLTMIDLLKSWLSEIEIFQVVDINTDALATLAVIMNIGIIFSQTRVRKQIIASLLLWSMKMVLNEVAINPAYLLAAKGSIATALVIVSVSMLFRSRNGSESVTEQNSSFHKMHVEVAEDSDVENELESSSNVGRTMSNYSPSITSTRFSPRSTNGTLIGPALLSSSHRSMHNSSFGWTGPSSADLLSNQNFSIRHEVAAADRSQVHRDITKLNISGIGSTSTTRDFNLNKSLNPFSLENSRCGSPTPSLASVFSGASRAHVISPPRLEPTFMAETATSWVGGGYWSSPQKRYLEAQSFSKNEMSRSSSQSSGLGTIDSDKNSRENSIIHEDFATSIFSEPIRRRNLFGRPQDTRSLYGHSFAQAPRVNNFFAANSFSNYRDSSSSFFK